MGGRITISDVARTAGVSMKSVSRVINREANISDKLRAKVRAAIDALGYVPDQAARSLAGARSFMIAVLFDNPSPNYTIKIQEGALTTCRENGFHLLVENIDSTAIDVAEHMQAILLNARIDGMILTPPITENAQILDSLEARGIPYVRIAPVSFPHRSPAVVIDDASAAAEVVQHLLALGHRRFGIVNGPASHGAAGTRRAGFMAAVDEAGGRVAEANGEFLFEQGIAAGLSLLSEKNRPSAIFAANDDMAAGVYAAAGQLALNVPDDVSIVGFDDSWIAQSVWPGLTTIHQPITDMAAAAARMLISGAPTDGPLTLNHQLVIRASTAPPKVP